MRFGGLKSGALDSGSDSLGLRQSPVAGVILWARPFTLIVPFSTYKYKWVLGNRFFGGGGSKFEIV